MEYRFLGNSGLKVSVISFGNWLNSNDSSLQQRTNDLIKKAHSLGINFFDTAEAYGFGEAERQLGVALKVLNIPRGDIVVSTKLFLEVSNPTINRIGLSRKHINEGINNSLKKLQLDYVDVVFAHTYDHFTPMEETCKAFDEIIKSGKALYWGTSKWSAASIFEAFMVCERFNLIKPIVEQPQYNMIIREDFEKGLGKLFDVYRYGATVWSPLLSGILTGKYNDGIPEDSRLKIFGEDSKPKAIGDKVFSEEIYLKNVFNTYFGPQNKEKYIKTLKGLGEIAQQLGCSQAQLAMAWVIKNKDVSSAITSASKPEQLEEIVGSLKFVSKITDEIEARINKLTGTQPTSDIDMRTFTPIPPRR